MKKPALALLIISTCCYHIPCIAQTSAHVDYPGFVALATEAESHRKSHLVDIDRFLAMAQDTNTVILDTRSQAAYQRKHFQGAVHLNFSDFTAAKLAALIPDKNTRILIYCNNNIEDDSANFPTKSMPLALNIPTFINLYGYGYKNVYELSSLLSVNHPKLVFEGTAVTSAR
jgi:hypothetical protein